MLKQYKNGLVLAFFSALPVSLITLVNMLTKPIIDEQATKQQQAIFDQIISKSFYDNELQKSCYVVKESQLGNGEHRLYIARRGKVPVGAIVEVSAPDGYSGAIKMLVGGDFSGTILGVRVIEHHETPGLGDKIELRLSDWISHFAGKVIHDGNDLNFAVKKDGGTFDQFTGATITSRAVVNAIKRAGLYIKKLTTQFSSLVTSEN